MYFACVHILQMYGIIFWGNSACSIDLYKIKIRKVRIINNLKYNISFRSYFLKMVTISIPNLYIYNAILFTIDHLRKPNHIQTYTKYMTTILSNICLSFENSIETYFKVC